MKTRAFPLALAAAFVGAAFRPGGASAVEVSQNLDAGVQQRYMGTGGNPKQAKFEEYHVVPNGLVLDSYSLDLDWGSYELGLRARNINQLDQSYRLSGGKPGSFSYKLSWDQAPHIYSYQAKTLYNAYGGTLSMDPVLRAANQATPTSYFANMSQSLALAPITSLQVQSDKAGLDLTFHPEKDWTVQIGGSQQHRYGARGIGASFGFSGAVEVPEPVDHVTQEGYMEIGYAKKEYQFDLRYDVSSFHNRFSNMTWDNPRRLDDRYVSAAAYVNGDGSAMGRMNLWPDSFAHTIALSGGVDLPLKTHLSAELGLAMWRQDDMLEPYTINSMIVPGAVLAPASPANLPPFNANDPVNLPIPSADRKINRYSQSYRLANSYIEGLRTSLAYRSYILENRSKAVTFPGWVRFDQVWEPGGSTPDRAEYRKDDVDWKADYELTKTVSLGAGYTFEYYKANREIPKTNEHSFDAGTTWKPTPDFFLNASYLVALRRARALDRQTYMSSDSTYLETPGLVRFDVGDRNRNQGRLQVQYNRGESTYALSWRVTQDHYRPGRQQLDGGPDFAGANLWQQYGLLRDDNQAAGIDVSQQLDKDWSVDAFYEIDFARRLVRSNTNAAVVTQDSTNDWLLRATETSNIGGVAVNYAPGPEWKLTAGYDLTASVGKAEVVTDPTGKLGSLPVTTRMQQSLKFKSRYQAFKNLAFTARYMYQKFDVSDYAWNNIPNITPDATGVFLGAAQKNYFVHVLGLGLDYRF